MNRQPGFQPLCRRHVGRTSLTDTAADGWGSQAVPHTLHAIVRVSGAWAVHSSSAPGGHFVLHFTADSLLGGHCTDTLLQTAPLPCQPAAAAPAPDQALRVPPRSRSSSPSCCAFRWSPCCTRCFSCWFSTSAASSSSALQEYAFRVKPCNDFYYCAAPGSRSSLQPVVLRLQGSALRHPLPENQQHSHQPLSPSGT